MVSPEVFGERMKHYTVCYVLDDLVARKYGNDKLFINYIKYWMYYRAGYLLSNVLLFTSLTYRLRIDMFNDLAKKVYHLKDMYSRYTSREKRYLDNFVDLLILNRVLTLNGYCDIFKLYEAIKNESRDHSGDYIVYFDEFCRRYSINDNEALVSLKVLMLFIDGVHISTMKKPKYKLPPRNIGFDALFIRKERFINNSIYYDKIINNFKIYIEKQH